MTERAEQLRQRAREEAADRALRFATARKTTGNFLTPSDPHLARVRPAEAGETTCYRCGMLDHAFPSEGRQLALLMPPPGRRRLLMSGHVRVDGGR